MSGKSEVDPERMKEIQERNKERNIIIQEIKSRRGGTVDELAKATGMEKAKLFKHLVAMRQFGKLVVVGERNSQLVYCLPETGDGDS